VKRRKESRRGGPIRENVMKRREESGRRAEAARRLRLLTVSTDVASQGLGSGCPPFNTAHCLVVLTWFDSYSKMGPEKKV
jgi:hypothetical protein